MGHDGFRRPRDSLHIFGEAFDVVRCVFHVVADVVGIRLGILLSLLETAFRAGMRAGVIDGLTLREQFDRSIDTFWFGSLNRSGESQRRKEEKHYYTN